MRPSDQRGCHTTVPDTIRICDHISPLLRIDDAALREYAERLKRRVSRVASDNALTRRTIHGAVQGLQDAPDRDDLLRHLVTQDCPRAAHALLRQLAGALPPARDRITCHLVPSAGTHGAGNCVADDQLLVTIPATEEAIPWMEFVIAHEYSHTQTDCPIDRATVRDFLISEGLAMVLAETFAAKPHPYPWDQVPPEQEAAFWKGVDPDARGLDAYATYMNSDASYEAGARVVRSYLRRHSISIAEAHHRPLSELYWDSGCEFVR